MCTLTYFLTTTGYELFFNRDEQRTRQPALSPKLNQRLGAIYPIDPEGQGTWLAVHQSGLSLALLNNYQAQQTPNQGNLMSRGQLIIALLKQPENIITNLKEMDLTPFAPFQVCIFPSELSKLKSAVSTFKWDGKQLTAAQNTQPITSSSIDFADVYQHRLARFVKIIDPQLPLREDFFSFHHSQEQRGKLSVKLNRSDALTVSLSHIVVDKKISFTYFDYLSHTQKEVTTARYFAQQTAIG